AVIGRGGDQNVDHRENYFLTLHVSSKLQELAGARADRVLRQLGGVGLPQKAVDERIDAVARRTLELLPQVPEAVQRRPTANLPVDGQQARQRVQGHVEARGRQRRFTRLAVEEEV